jgi:hypothetical protein
VKKIIYISTILSFMCSRLNAQEFDKKQTVKELKIFLKDPEKYHNDKKSINERFLLLEQEVIKSKMKAEEAQVEIDDKNKIIADLKAENTKLKTCSNNGFEQDNTNTQYRVQIGVYNKFSINHFLNSAKCIITSKVNGNNVYDIIGFNNLNEASTMTKEIRKMGLQDAFITKYVNGKRDNSFDANHVNKYSLKSYYSNPKTYTIQPKIRNLYKDTCGILYIKK